MSTNRRPGAVTVIAVLNFVLGGMGLLQVLCGGGALLVGFSFLQNAPKPPAGQPDVFAEMSTLFTSIPGYVPFLIGSLILNALLCIALIVSGFGLLKVRPWARNLCLAYAVINILAVIVGTVYQFAVVQPATNKWQEEFQAKMQAKMPKRPGAPAPAGPPPSLNMISGAIGVVMGAVIGIAYSLVVLIVLNLPDVKRAFAGLPPLSGTDEEAARGWSDSAEDRFDEGRGRLRSDDDRFQ